MPRLNAENRAIAEQAGQDLLRYSKIAEKHSTILRTNMNHYAEVYEEYVRKAPPMGYLSAPHEVDDHVAQCEQLLIDKADCTEFIDHLAVYNACSYLTRILMRKMNDLGNEIASYAMKTSTELRKKDPALPCVEAVWPTNPNPSFLRLFPSPVPPAALPPVDQEKEPNYGPQSLPSSPLHSSQIRGKPRAKVTSKLLNQFKQNPTSLQNQIFVRSWTGCDEEEIFRVSAILAGDGYTSFYLTFVDEVCGEASRFLSEEFFHMLSTFEHVVAT